MRITDFVVKEPMVIGHEYAGIIEVGSEVKNLIPGDSVAVRGGSSPGQPIKAYGLAY